MTTIDVFAGPKEHTPTVAEEVLWEALLAGGWGPDEDPYLMAGSRREKSWEDQPREPAGSPEGGQFASEGGTAAFPMEPDNEGGFVGMNASWNGMHTPQGREYGVEDGYAFHEQNNGWVDSLSRDERNSVASYSGFSSEQINGLLRGGEAEQAVKDDLARFNKTPEELDARLQQYRDLGDRIQEVIDKGPVFQEDTVVYRGMSLSSEQELRDLVDRGEMNDPAFQSTMLGLEERAKGYAVLDQGHHELFKDKESQRLAMGDKIYPERTSVFARIVVPAGTHYADVEAIRRNPQFSSPGYRGESEILLSRGGHYEVDAVKFNAGTEVYDPQRGIKVTYHELHLTYREGK